MTIYLDNAATSYPKPPQVLTAMQQFQENIGANPGRSGHRASVEAGRVLYDGREALAELLGIEDPLNIAFTMNATMALNTALLGILERGDHVITSSMEHNSVARPLRWLEEKGTEVTRLSCNAAGGELDPDAVRRAIKANTKLVAVTHASNVSGTIMPLSQIGAITRRFGVSLLVDAAQTAGAQPIDVEAMGIDVLAFTGHKSLFGPQGTGGLYVNPSLKVRPLLRGGTGSRSEEDVHPDFMPDRLESGTPNTVGVAGLGAGVRFILGTGVENIAAHKRRLTERFLAGLSRIDGVTIYGPGNGAEQAPIISLNIAGMECSEVGQSLDEEYGILVRCGLHCAPWAHETLATYPEGSVRISLGYFTCETDIDKTLDALREIAGRRQ